MIKIIKESVVFQTTDAIVNAANKTLLGGGGVDGAIHREAGKGLFEECRTLGGCETGKAKITKGYNLNAKYVIHTVGPVYDRDKKPEKLLASCYRSSLKLAQKNGIHSIAFPCISTGIYGFPIEKACRIALKTVAKWLYWHDSKIEVTLCCFNDREFEAFKKILLETEGKKLYRDCSIR